MTARGQNLGATAQHWCKPRDAGRKKPAGSGPVPARTAEPSRAVAPAHPSVVASSPVSGQNLVRKGADTRYVVVEHAGERPFCILDTTHDYQPVAGYWFASRVAAQIVADRFEREAEAEA